MLMAHSLIFTFQFLIVSCRIRVKGRTILTLMPSVRSSQMPGQCYAAHVENQCANDTHLGLFVDQDDQVHKLEFVSMIFASKL